MCGCADKIDLLVWMLGLVDIVPCCSVFSPRSSKPHHHHLLDRDQEHFSLVPLAPCDLFTLQPLRHGSLRAVTSLPPSGWPCHPPSRLQGGEPPHISLPDTPAAIIVGGLAGQASTTAAIMPYTQLPKACSDPEIPPGHPGRPRFHHRCTEDRLREGLGRPPSFSMSNKIAKERKSIFKELGLDTNQPKEFISNEKEFGEPKGLASPANIHAPESANRNADDAGRRETARRLTHGEEDGRVEPQSEPASPSPSQRPWYSRLPRVRRPRIKSGSSAPPSMSTITRLSSVALLIAVLLPGFSYYQSREEAASNLAEAGVIQTTTVESRPILERRNTPTEVCKRWAHQGECRARHTRT